MTDKELYEWYKSKGICPHCGKDKAVKGKIHCVNCLETFAVSQMIRRSKLTEEQKQYEHDYCIAHHKKQYQKLKAQGICTKCKKRKASPGKVKCSICLAKDARYKRLKRAEVKNEN